MDADLGQASTPAQHSGGLGQGGLGVVEVGVGQHRDDRIERAVGERQGSGVGADQPADGVDHGGGALQPADLPVVPVGQAVIAS
jgi:hypothetical protein